MFSINKELDMKKILLLGFVLLQNIALGVAQEVDSTAVEAPVEEQMVPSVSVQQADSAYMNGDYKSAIAVYEAIVERGGASADLYYNLGNCYYKSKQVAKSILNYERALKIDPSDSDIRFNLELARTKAIDKESLVSEIFLVTWFTWLKNCMSVDEWAMLALGCFILFLVAIAYNICSRNASTLLRKLTFIVLIVTFVGAVLGNVFAKLQKDTLQNQNMAIIMNSSVTVKSTPNESGTDLFVLHEGRKVTITDNSMKQWVEIQLEDGNVGWIPRTVLEVI